MLDYCRKISNFVRIPVVAITIAAAAFLSGTATAQAQFNAAQKAEIEKIIKDYLVKNPAVLRDALIALQKHNAAEERAKRERAVSALGPKLINSKYQVVLGNPNGKINLVEFFDYNCGYCRRAMIDLEKLIGKNPDLRVVLKEFPVLGAPSRDAAIVASALQLQFDGKKYWTFHRRLMTMRGRVGKAQALAAARASGADMNRLAKDMENPEIIHGLQEVSSIAEALNMTGTPSYVVGQAVVIGAVGFDSLQRHIDNLRKCGKNQCG